jgi:hypothetical protein
VIDLSDDLAKSSRSFPHALGARLRQRAAFIRLAGLREFVTVHRDCMSDYEQLHDVTIVGGLPAPLSTYRGRFSYYIRDSAACVYLP